MSNLKSEEVTIKQQWNTFAKNAIPNIAVNSIQYREMRRAFYSGVVAGLMMLQDIPDTKTEEEIEAYFEGWYKENQMRIATDQLQYDIQHRKIS
jgi:hypothetical protein